MPILDAKPPLNPPDDRVEAKGETWETNLKPKIQQKTKIRKPIPPIAEFKGGIARSAWVCVFRYYIERRFEAIFPAGLIFYRNTYLIFFDDS